MYKATLSTISSFAIAGFFLLGTGGIAGAQNMSSNTGHEQQRNTQAHHGKMSATGCIERGGDTGSFTLKTDSGKTYDLTSQKVQLAEHVGHKVKVHGYATQNSGSASAANENPSANAEGSHPTGNPNAAEVSGMNGNSSANAESGQQQDNNTKMTVTKLKMVSTECSTM